MHSRPGLFEPVHYSQRSLITGTVYNSPDEIYTFDEDAGPNDVPRGVFTALTKCYSYKCDPQQGSCYAPQCPNKKENFEMEFTVSFSNLPIFICTLTFFFFFDLDWTCFIATIILQIQLYYANCNYGKIENISNLIRTIHLYIVLFFFLSLVISSYFLGRTYISWTIENHQQTWTRKTGSYQWIDILWRSLPQRFGYFTWCKFVSLFGTNVKILTMSSFFCI
jgi:hypothetical protein